VAARAASSPLALPPARPAVPATTPPRPVPPATVPAAAPETLATAPVRAVLPTTPSTTRPAAPAPRVATTTVVTAPPTTTTTTTSPPAPVGSDRGSGQVTYYDHPAGRCASPWLPFGTVVTITNPATGATVACTVDDREADTARAIDLSTATFAQLAPLSQGVVDARLRW